MKQCDKLSRDKMSHPKSGMNILHEPCRTEPESQDVSDLFKTDFNIGAKIVDIQKTTDT